MKGGGLGGVQKQVAEIGDWRVAYFVDLGFQWQEWVTNSEMPHGTLRGRWVTRGAGAGSNGRPPANAVTWAA